MIIDNQEYKVIVLQEESLGLANSNEIKQMVDSEINSGNLFLAFDLSKLDSINSAGLGVLIGILNKIKSNNGCLKMLNINDRVLNIFKITKLDLVFEINN